MAVDRTIFDEPHYQSLEFLAARSLADGNPGPAYRFADRRCRILPTPESHCYVLRAEASYQMGVTAAAVADIARALEINPSDIGANRRMLEWARGPERIKAALALIGQEREAGYLRKAIQILYEHGHRHFARAVAFEATIEGWALWENDGPLSISITDGVQNTSTRFSPDILHSLADYGSAVSFSIHRPKSSKAQSILFATDDSIFYTARAASNAVARRPGIYRSQASARRSPVTVIIPVYDDFHATKLCIDTLHRELITTKHQAIMINDATPDPRIARYLAEFDAERVTILVNDRNLGFIGSVNRALERVDRGDVVILNADTVTPPRFIDRLAAIAHSSADIGTVTPLSNNGEFTSFPMPNACNPLLSCKSTMRIDEIAAKINVGRTVDIPSGIGFCLYATRACLDAVGLLSEDFGHGYLEDADFCLRARDHGFRSVCATSVYVGHAGSKSFKERKRSIVVRNLNLLERRFPKHRLECAAFMAADPLRPAREAIERAAATETHRPRLLVTGAGAVSAIAHRRGSEIASERQPAFILEVNHRAAGATVKIRNALGGIPQSLKFSLQPSSEAALLFDFLNSTSPRRIELFDPTNTPSVLLDLLLRLKVPYDLFIADGGLLGPGRAQPFAQAVSSYGVRRAYRQAHHPKGIANTETRNWNMRWRRIADDADKVLVPSAEAEAFVATVLPNRAVHKIRFGPQGRGRKAEGNQNSARCRLGLVSVRACAQEQWLLTEVARIFGRKRPDISVMIIGGTLDDIDLMRATNAFVTGTVRPEEFNEIAASLGLDRLFVSTTRPLFGHPIQLAVHATSLPIAYFDWSNGRAKSRKRDLSIDPSLLLNDFIAEMSRWIPAP